MNVWHDIAPERITPERFIACIEIPKGCKNKYEVDKDTGMLILDRILHTSTHYPADYGFIPRTYADDGDPLDVLVLCSEQIVPLALVECCPIGHIAMIDEGAEDIKVLAVPLKDPNMNCYTDASQLPPHIVSEIKHFFDVYKQLEGKTMTVLELYGRADTLDVIDKAISAYGKRFGGKARYV